MRCIVASILACGLVAVAGTAAAFDVDFTVIDGSESYLDIQIKGTMTDWIPVPMDDTDGDHVWTLTLDVPAGAHEWGVIENDGSEWGIWLIPGPNLELTVDAEGNVSGQTTFEIPVPSPTVEVTFLVDMSAETVSAAGVHVAGSFQSWQPDTTEMLDPDGDGVYAVTLALAEHSVHQYRFINGADWNGSESVPAECGVDDQFGGYNRLIQVVDADQATQVAAWVFGACDVPTPVETSTLSGVKALFR